VRGEFRYAQRDAARVPIGFVDAMRIELSAKCSGIRTLMIVGGIRDWNDERRQAECRNLGERARAARAHDEIARRECAGHIRNERFDRCRHALRCVCRSDRRGVAEPRLMPHGDGETESLQRCE
jgi:hypothetical protein